MTLQKSLLNPHFLEYVRLLRDLHELIRNGTDETPKGERLRDNMDEPAEYLSAEETARVNGISADFYTLTDPPPPLKPLPENLPLEMSRRLLARSPSEHLQTLDFLRSNQDYFEPAQLAYLRGKLWFEIGEPNIAVDFLTRAWELEPANQNFLYSWLTVSVPRFPEQAERQIETILTQPDNYAAVLVLKAAELRFESAMKLPKEKCLSMLEPLVPVLQTTIFQLQTTGSLENGQGTLAAALTLLGFCQEQLGHREKALQSFTDGLHLYRDLAHH